MKPCPTRDSRESLELFVNWTHVVALLAAFFCLSLIAADPSPPKRAFFPLPKFLAEKIQKSFEKSHSLKETDIPAGIYYSHPDYGRMRSDVIEKRMGDRKLVFDGSYLATDNHLTKLYGDDKWRVQKPGRFVKDGDSWQKKSFDEFRFVVGWIRAEREDGVVSDQLWVVAPSGARWLLLEKGSFGIRKKFFSAIPEFFVPVSDGALVFPRAGRNKPDEAWKLNLMFVGGKSLGTFPYTDFDNKTGMSEFRVAVTGSGDEAQPLVFEGSEQKVLFAGWLASEKKGARTLELSSREATRLFFLDLETGAITEALRARWPFWVDADTFWMGVPLSSPSELDRRTIDWKKATIGRLLDPVKLASRWKTRFGGDGLVVLDRRQQKYRLTSAGQPIAMSSVSYRELTKDDKHRVEMLGMPTDVINQNRIGEGRTFFSHQQFERDIASVLGGRSGGDTPSAVLLVYREGEPVQSLLESFFWSLDEGIRSFPPSLKEVEHAFRFDPAHIEWAQKKRKPSTLNLYETLKEIRSISDSRRVVIHLSDYPSKGIDAGKKSEKESAINRMRELSRVFSTYTKAGRVRLIVSIPELVWKTLKDDSSSPFSGFKVVQIKKEISDYNHRVQIARAIFSRTAVKENLSFNSKAFSRALTIAERERRAFLNDEGSDLGFYPRYFGQLVSYAASELGTGKEISASFVDQFEKERERTYTNWRLVTRPFGEAEMPGPQWYDPLTNDRPAVLTGDYLAQWMRARQRLINEDIYGHAIFLGTSKEGAEQLILLRPKHKLEVLLERKVEYAKLHPKGFYAAVEDSGVTKLIFFEIDFKKQPGDDKAPGTQRLLAAKLEKALFADPKNIDFKYGKLWIKDTSGWRVFSPTREESVSGQRE